MTDSASPTSPPDGTAPAQTFGSVSSRCPTMWAVFDVLRQATSSQQHVLLEGEPGTGKLSLAAALHDLARPDQPFTLFRCDLPDPHEVHAALFGRDGPGALEAAGRGTLFLHRVEDLPRQSQPLLRQLLTAGEIVPYGAARLRPLPVRVVSASERPLRVEVARDKFDADLLGLLGGLRAEVPSVRSRADAPATFDASQSFRDARAQAEASFEQRYVAWLVARHHGNLSAAAREARMDRKHLYDLACKHGLRAARSRRASP